LKNPRDLSGIRQQAAERLARRKNVRRDSGDRSSFAAGDDGGAPPSAFFAPPPPAAEGDYGRILPTEADSSETGAGGSEQAGIDADSAPPASGANGGRRGRMRGHDEPAEDDDELNLQLAFYPMTDLGNAERFSARYRDRLKFCPQLGWLWWNGKHWSRLNAFQKVTEAIHDTVRGIQREAQALIDSGRDCVIGTKNKGKRNEEDLTFSDVLSDWGRSSEGAGHMSSIAGKEGGNAAAYLAIDETALDTDPFKINVLNGTLVLRKGARDGELLEFRRQEPADLITKIMPVEYSREAECPHYDGFFAEVQPHASMRRFLHQWGGLSLTGDVSEQKFAFFYGKGRNGKSTLLEGWAHVAGDYGRAVPVETFVSDRPRSGSGPSPDLAMLRSVRFAHTTEPEKGVRLSEGLVKLVTGGDQVPARELNMPFFMLRPAFKLTMSGNYKPRIEGGEATHGIWRRVCFVPWLVTIAEDKIDRKLPDKLRAEASGILNRLLDGLRDWAERGLVLPDEVVEATEAYRAESDPLGRFLQTCIVAEPGHREQSSLVYDVFNAWATAAGERGSGGKVWSPRGFAQAMSERGYSIKHSNVNWWTDIRLVRGVSDFVDHEGKPRKDADAGAATASVPDDVVPL
jgi:putative DNA primase/helicase